MNKLIFLFTILIISTSVAAQKKEKIDSIKIALKAELPAQKKASLYYNLSELFGFEQIDSAFYYADRSSETIDDALNSDKNADKNALLKIKAEANNNLGVLSEVKGNSADALKYVLESTRARESLKDESGLIEAYGNLATMYLERGDVNKSMDYCYKKILLTQKLNNKEEEAKTYNAMARIFMLQEDEPKARQYYNTALKIGNDLQSAVLRCTVYNNLGNLYRRSKPDSSLFFFEKGLKYAYDTKDDRLLASSLSNIGSAYDIRMEYDKAKTYLLECIAIREKRNFKSDLASTYNNLARLYYKTSELKKAEEAGVKSLDIAIKLNYPEDIANSSEILYKVYRALGNYKKATEMLEATVEQRKKIFNDSDRKISMKKQLQFEYEKEKVTDSIQTANERIITESKHQEEIHRQKIYTYAGIIGFLLMLGLCIFAYRSFLIKKRSNTIIAEQKRLVEDQKSEIEEKQKEIIDSISYAKRLQQAILPPVSSFSSQLKDHFIFYKPKDIVAGDFYWMENIGDEILIAAADCTGHGVPGALVSIVCSNALNRSVLEFGITEPGMILGKVRELVLETFAKSESEVKDGMDISLVSINRITGTVKWAGANNPLWYIQKGEMKEIKANKQPIGSSDNPQPFTTHTLQLGEDDSLYLFTDGYADQFGGDKGKKFKYKQLSEKITESKHMTMAAQSALLNKIFEEWKGNLEQIDDVCIIGVRL
jgi:serine phosphatase RsbU (regulator of sigma subunit)/Tfp pilus assembly protein PilF